MTLKASFLGLALVLSSASSFAGTSTLVGREACGYDGDTSVYRVQYLTNSKGEVSADLTLLSWGSMAAPAADDSGGLISFSSLGVIESLTVKGTDVVDKKTGTVCATPKKPLLGKRRLDQTKSCSIETSTQYLKTKDSFGRTTKVECVRDYVLTVK